MSNDPLRFMKQYRAAATAVNIRYPFTFSWLGEAADTLSPSMRRALGSDRLPGRLQQLLIQRFYESFYCKGRPCAIGWDRIGLRSPAHNVFLRDALSEANEGQGYFQEDWQRLGSHQASGLTTVERNQLRIRVPDSALRKNGKADSSVAVRFSKELVNGLPSFYIAMGDVELPDEAIPTCVRLYWNTDPSAAVQLTQALTTHLNRQRIPFRFKVVSDPTLFNRHDAAVLYLRPEDYEGAFAALDDALPTLLPILRAGVPAFTRQLAPGLAVAEDPGEQGDSFGLHRCRHLVQGLLTAAEQGIRDVDGQVQQIIESLETAGIDPEKPYLRPNSEDRYGIDLPSPVPRKATPRHVPSAGQARRPEEVAVLLGNRLVNEAIWHGERCTWLGHEDHFNSTRTTPVYRLATLSPDLYTGTGGIALFLADLFHHTGEPTFRQTALGALRQALHGEETSSKAREPLYPGFFGGAAGVALAARRVAERCEAEELATTAQNLLLRTLEPSLESWENDLVTGVAGALLGLAGLRSDNTTDALHIRDAGKRCIHSLAAKAQWEGSTASWHSPAFPRPYNLTGYLHGAAGIAHALLEWHALDPDPAILQLAEAAFAYEDGFFDEERGWPDLRTLRLGETPRNWPALWCHGAAGIALARARAFEITGRAHHRQMAQAAIHLVIRDVQTTLEESRGNFSLAEGLIGSIDSALLAAHRADPDRIQILEGLATDVAAVGMDRHLHRGLPWSGGVASGEAPGLFLGLAGTGHFYLRRSAPDIPSPLFFAASPRESEAVHPDTQTLQQRVSECSPSPPIP